MKLSKGFTDEDLIGRLAKKFQVSKIAMSYRLANLGFI
jgi:Zn-dependent peptidase ImmA (M78 family)